MHHSKVDEKSQLIPVEQTPDGQFFRLTKSLGSSAHGGSRGHNIIHKKGLFHWAGERDKLSLETLGLPQQRLLPLSSRFQSHTMTAKMVAKGFRNFPAVISISSLRIVYGGSRVWMVTKERELTDRLSVAAALQAMNYGFLVVTRVPIKEVKMIDSRRNWPPTNRQLVPQVELARQAKPMKRTP
jgi:hypothetical protein